MVLVFAPFIRKSESTGIALYHEMKIASRNKYNVRRGDTMRRKWLNMLRRNGTYARAPFFLRQYKAHAVETNSASTRGIAGNAFHGSHGGRSGGCFSVLIFCLGREGWGLFIWRWRFTGIGFGRH